MWMRTGRSDADFWRQTPRTLGIVLNAHREIIEHDRRRDAWLALNTAALIRKKKGSWPTIDELLGIKPKLAVQSPDEMKAAFRAWRAQGA